MIKIRGEKFKSIYIYIYILAHATADAKHSERLETTVSCDITYYILWALNKKYKKFMVFDGINIMQFFYFFNKYLLYFSFLLISLLLIPPFIIISILVY